MEFVEKYWLVWLIGLFIGYVIHNALSRNRQQDIHAGMATRSEEFSIKGIFFNVYTGEGALFFTVFFSIISAFLFSLAFAKKLGTVFF